MALKGSYIDVKRLEALSEDVSYRLGYPSAGRTVEPNVLAQWKFNESSGAIVDTVGGLSLAVGGSPTFGVSESAPFDLISPGITYNGSSYHHKDTATPSLDIGLNDLTFECWLKTTTTSNGVDGNRVIFSFQDFLGSGRGASFQLRNGLIPMFEVITENDFFAYDQADYNASLPLSDGTPHHLRWAINRTANTIAVYQDGVSISQHTIGYFTGTTLVGQTIKNYTTQIARENDNADQFIGTLYEARLSANATNNSFSPSSGA